MPTLTGKKILLAISGGIAAYKCAELTRRLIERGAIVRVVMTSSAKEFITPLTMQSLSGHPVHEEIFDLTAQDSMGHIELAKWADLILIAPATADIIARLAAGMANDLLTTLVLASDSPIAVAPAMNQQMFKNPATQKNIKTIRDYGMSIWGPASGAQACGDIGYGRMLEPTELVDLCSDFFQPNLLNKALLNGKSILITAGPTQEAIDPVRYISNHSSGKMGYALANAAAQLGANVTLVSGPVSIAPPENVTLLPVTTAQEMFESVMPLAQKQDIVIGCAAVADYRPANIADQKIKKDANSNVINIDMIQNPDIIASVAALKESRPYTVGFSAETEDLEQNALKKLNHKNLDMICANNVALEGQGFNSSHNALTLYWKALQKSEKFDQKDLLLDTKENQSYAIMKTISQQLIK